MTTEGIPSIEISGTMVNRRHMVKIDGLAVWISGVSFRYILRLAWALYKAPGGWISRKDFDNGNSQTQSLQRLRHEIAIGHREMGLDLPEWAAALYECDNYKRVRLVVGPESITIAAPVADLPDAEIKTMVKDIRRKEKEHASHGNA